MGSEICIISPYPKLTSLLASHFSGVDDPPRIFADNVMDGSEAILRQAEQAHAEVIVTTAFHARKLRRTITVPVVEIPLSTFDIAMAISNAKQRFGAPIAMLEPHETSPHLEAIGNMLACRIKSFIFSGPKEARERIRQAQREGFVCGVGGGLSEGIAHDLGFAFLTLLPGPEVLDLALQQAQQIAEVQRHERYEVKKIKNIVNFASSGIIVADGDAVISVFNPSAEKVLLLSSSEVLNRSVGEVFPHNLFDPVTPAMQPLLAQIKSFGKKQLVVNTIPITDRGRSEGTIFTFQEISHIQSLEEKIRRASHRRPLHARLTFADIVAKSPSSQTLVHRAKRFAASDETILITGETGTGKEIFAQSLHNASTRRDRPFVAVSCAAIPANLLESELFGYVEGAFTGALRGGKPGFFELAHGGTIFLDEIGEVSLETQVTLLRVLQEREVMRIGDRKVVPVDVRVMAATNTSLHAAVHEGQFRLDLYHRLNILRIEIPPLRQRQDDIVPLIGALLRQLCPTKNLAKKIYSRLLQQEQELRQYDWPGNVRELENLLRRMIASLGIAGAREFEAEARLLLDETLHRPVNPQHAASPTLAMPPGDYKDLVAVFEQAVLNSKLNELAGNKTQLAKELGIGRTTLWRKLKKQ
ncbi:MAG: sigma 54-interacting transcriptional regulator [Desulfopila sp.]